jgi:protein-arginine kinase activator protein McsA
MNKKNTSDFLKFLGIQNQITIQEGEEEGEKKIENIKCPACKKTLEDIKKNTYIDCDICYETFLPVILETLRRITGERLPAQNNKNNLDTLIKKINKKLKEEILVENYEICSILKNKLQEINNYKLYISSQNKIIKKLIKLEKYDAVNDIKNEINKKIKEIIEDSSNYLQ